MSYVDKTGRRFDHQNHPGQVRKRGAVDAVDDRRTPDDLFDECRALAGVEKFDLDPAATPASARADSFYTIVDDGLTKPWAGSVWINPPYSDLKRWLPKITAEATHCDVIAALLPGNRMEQRVFQEHVELPRRRGDVEVFFIERRRPFNLPDGSAGSIHVPFGLCLAVWS